MKNFLIAAVTCAIVATLGFWVIRKPESQPQLIVTVSAFDVQGGPPCAGKVCSNTVEVFGTGAVFPSSAWKDVPDGVTLVRYKVSYRDGCTPDVHCPSPERTDAPSPDGSFKLWVTPQKLFWIVAIGSNGRHYEPRLENWRINQDPVYGGVRIPERLSYVLDPNGDKWMVVDEVKR